MKTKKTSQTMLALLTAVVITCALGSARASIITQPAGLGVGDQYRLVFVTSTTRNANSQLIADYDVAVSNAAVAVAELSALGTTWLDIGSTGPHGGGATVLAPTHTLTRPVTDPSYPIYRLDGTLVATGNADLWDGTLAASISINELGNTLSTMVWTGTMTNGNINGDWYLGDTGGGWRYYGQSANTDSTWTQNLGEQGGTVHSLYGISGVLTAVPEPSTLSLLGLILAGFVIRRRRK